MANLAEMVKHLEQERSQIVSQAKKLKRAISVLRTLARGDGLAVMRKPSGKRRTMSASARRRIAAAQRARWAKWKRKKKVA